MKRNFTDEDFEGFLRQNADGLRMRPSADVWKGIAKNLNRRKRRTTLIIASFLLVATTFSYYLNEYNTGPVKPLTTKQNTKAVPHQGSTGAITPATTLIPQALAAVPVTAAPFSRYRSTAISRETTPVVAAGETIQAPAANPDNGFTATILDNDEYSGFAETTQPSLLSASPATDPLSIESVTNVKLRGKKQLEWQLLFIPTISYRKLGENKSYLHDQQNAASVAGNPYGDVNNAVTHKPDFGLQLGLAAKYPITKNLKLKGGLQFDINRYDIKTFSSSTAIATIKFNGRYAGDSLNRITNISNVNGYQSNWLENLYFKVSAPFGVEMKLRGDEKMQFGVAGTIQPTYVLGDKTYLISTDYKNYTQVPDLVRRWNVNTSVETFVSYYTGHLKWQVGPQVRYQLLSSYVSKYPVKENLFDFGLKVGVSLNKY